MEAKYELGLVDLLKNQPAQSLQRAKEIVALRPDYRPGRLLRIESLALTGDLNTARAELSKLVNEDPKDNQVQYLTALMAMKEKKYPEAIDILNSLRNNGDPQVFVTLAAIQSSRKEFDKAYNTLNEGLSKTGDAYVMHDQMGVTAVFAGQFDRALSEFGKVLEVDPTSVVTMRRLADLYTIKGDQSNALKYYHQAYDAAPNDVTSALALAGALSQAGRPAEAKNLYLSIVKAHPEDPIALNNTAYLLADTGSDLDEALRYAQKALSKVPGQPGFTDTVGYVYLKKGLNDSAMQTFGNLVRKYPNVAAFRYHLALVLYAKGDKASARKELQTALGQHPSRQDEQRIKDLLSKT